MGIPKNNLMIMGGIAGTAILLLLGGAFWFLKKRKKKKLTVEVAGSLPEGAKAATDGDKQLPAGGKADEKSAKAGNGTPEVSEEEAAEIAALKAAQEEKQVLGSIKLPETTSKKASILTKHISEEAKKNPDAVAQIVRTWLNNEDGA